MSLEAATAANQIDNRIFRIGTCLKLLRHYRHETTDAARLTFMGDWTIRAQSLEPFSDRYCAYDQLSNLPNVFSDLGKYWDIFALRDSGLPEVESPDRYGFHRLALYRDEEAVREKPNLVIDTFPEDGTRGEQCHRNKVDWAISDTDSPLRHSAEVSLVNAIVEGNHVGNICQEGGDEFFQAFIEDLDAKLVTLQRMAFYTQKHASVVQEGGMLSEESQAAALAGALIRRLKL